MDYHHDVGAGWFGESEITMNSWTFPSVRHDGCYLVAGLGTTGLAAIRWCLRAGAALRVVDTRPAPSGLAALRQWPGHQAVDLRLDHMDWTADLLTDVHTIVISPGLSPLTSPLKQLLKLAREREVEIVGETELFAMALRDLNAEGYTPRVLAVTGTNGKTTVTAMTAHLLAAAGVQVQVAGNIAPAALDALTDALDSEQLPDAWVIELSSFQLFSTRSLQAHAVALLNISQDHLDWHGSWQAYVQAKANLLHQGGVAVVNRDDDTVMQAAAAAALPEALSFGSDAPESEGDMGVVSKGPAHWLAHFHAGASHVLMPAAALGVPGHHNQLNAQAALQLVLTAGVPMETALSALPTYKGEAHRMAFVRSVAGVDFYNDSKGTNVAATVAALQGGDSNVVLIAGGQGKGQDFSPLIAAATQHVKSVMLIGEAAPELKALLEAAGVPAQVKRTLEDAVNSSFGQAVAGDRVILSPACASHDMFVDYGERGRLFVAAVESLALDHGEVA